MGELIEVTVDDGGRITIPQPMRERFGLQPGTKLVVEEDEDGLRLHPPVRTATLIEKDGILIVHGEATGDLADFVRRERERRVIELLRRSSP